MSLIAQRLESWRLSLPSKIELGALVARSPVAHKWMAPFRSLVLRETIFWRTQDLLKQSYELHISGHALGARILLRSALETVATLIYLNRMIAEVVGGTLNFHEFSTKTARLLLGKREESVKHQAINILTVLKQCEKNYPGILGVYAVLSETAHPNFEGMCFGYSRVDHENDVSICSNNMREMYEDIFISSIERCMNIFEHEYNNEWSQQFDRLEAWIVENDKVLEATKGKED